MAKRILPFRDYSEHEVLNLYSLATSAEPIGDNDAVEVTLTAWKQDAAVGQDNDAGVVVAVKGGILPGDSPSQAEQAASSAGELRDYLGSSHGGQNVSHIGYSAYPHNNMTVEAASGQSPAIGITLKETLAYDENMEKMLYYPQKLDEAQGVLPGQSVPILTRGLVLLDKNCFTAQPTLGQGLTVDAGDDRVANKGLLVPATASSADVGTVIATGAASNDGGASHVLCKLSF